ncbi:MAG TPA: hypothetical protein VIF82_09155 [Burkholderiaceae bacterium]|jgi:hypothetical protein
MSDYKYGRNVPPHRRWPVAWYNPMILLNAAKDMASTSDALRNFDRRETYSGTLEFTDLSQSSHDGDFWWDFASDMGDGGSATYAVALAAQTPILTAYPAGNCKLPVDHTMPTTFPAGQLLILGGDLCYPGASAEEYQYRFIEMWEGARQDIGSQNTPKKTVLAIPQNHDWFDNASTFQRYFINYDSGQFIGAETPQKRTYFATKLPHDWWVFGLDWALVGDIDRKQFEAYQELIDNNLKAGDNVVLLYPEPYWTRALGDEARPGYPKRYQRLEAYLLEKNIRIRIHLAGDLHHYVREESPSDEDASRRDMLITCGSGGAFLHPTHTKRVLHDKVMDLEKDSDAMFPDLASRVRIGTSNKTVSDTERRYTQIVSYPDRITSATLALQNLFAFFRLAGKRDKRIELSRWTSSNLMFSLLLGLLYCTAIYCNAFVFTESFRVDGFIPAQQISHLDWHHFIRMWGHALFFSPLALSVHVILIGLCCAIANEDGPRVSIITGIPHALTHILTAATLYWIASHFVDSTLVRGLIVLVAGTIIGGVLFGSYFTLMSWLGYLTNNAFSPMSNQNYKGFLRFRIDASGDLHGYMIGCDKVPKRWKLNPGDGFPIWQEDDPRRRLKWRVRDGFTLKR